jgi:hypothetical protein
MKVGVIGSGPSSAVVVSNLIKLGYQVEVIDIGEIYDNSISEKNISVKLKSFFGSNFIYDQTSLKYNSLKGVFPSKSYGGYSLVWGATLSTMNQQIGEEYYFEPNLVKVGQSKSLFLKDEKFGLAIDKSLCNFCGQCLIGCKQGAIWDSRRIFDPLIKDGKIKYFKSRVKAIVENGNMIKINTDNIDSLLYEKVVLCTGPLSTVKILHESRAINLPITLNDCETFFGVLLRFPKLLGKSEFALTQRIFSIKNEKDTIARVQLYLDPRGLRYRYIPIKYANLPLIRLIFIVISSFCVPFIGYLPEKNSNQIFIEEFKEDISVKIKINREKIHKFRFYRKLFTSFSGLRMLLVGYRFSGTGSGYHFGGLRGNDSADSIRLSSKVQGFSNLFVMDASILDVIPFEEFTSGLMKQIEIRVKNLFPDINVSL